MTHPLTRQRREAVVSLWHDGKTQDDIAFELGIDVLTVRSHLRRARRANDPRAAKRVRNATVMA